LSIYQWRATLVRFFMNRLVKINKIYTKWIWEANISVQNETIYHIHHYYTKPDNGTTTTTTQLVFLNLMDFLISSENICFWLGLSKHVY